MNAGRRTDPHAPDRIEAGAFAAAPLAGSPSALAPASCRAAREELAEEVLQRTVMVNGRVIRVVAFRSLCLAPGYFRKFYEDSRKLKGLLAPSEQHSLTTEESVVRASDALASEKVG